eukprot:2943051-Pyramimonas_sp.AAC.1
MPLCTKTATGIVCVCTTATVYIITTVCTTAPLYVSLMVHTTAPACTTAAVSAPPVHHGARVRTLTLRAPRLVHPAGASAP